MTLRDLSHIMSCFEGDSCRRYSYWVLSNDIRNPIGYFCSLCSLVSILADFKFVSSITFKSDLRIRKCVQYSSIEILHSLLLSSMNLILSVSTVILLSFLFSSKLFKIGHSSNAKANLLPYIKTCFTLSNKIQKTHSFQCSFCLWTS